MARNFLGIDDSQTNNIGTRKPRVRESAVRTNASGITPNVTRGLSGRNRAMQREFEESPSAPTVSRKDRMRGVGSQAAQRQIGMTGRGVTENRPITAIPSDIAGQAIDTSSLKYMTPLEPIGKNVSQINTKQGIAPASTGLGIGQSLPQADANLSAMYDSQQPQELGGYSPAGIQEAAAYRAQRDLGDNQTQMSPTDFGQYSEGIGGNTLEWDMNDTVAAMSPEQRQQLRAASEYQQLGMAPELPSDIEQGQQAIGLSQQRLSHDIAQSKKQKPIEYGMADGVAYPKSGAEGKAFMEKRQKQRQRLINVMSDPKQSKKDVSRAQIIFNNTFGGL